MKTIRIKIAQIVSLALRNGITRGRMVAAITLLVIAAIAPLAAAALKTMPVVSTVNQGQLQPGHFPKPAIIKTIVTEEVTVQENRPSKTEKLFSIIVGMVLPVSILSLFFYLQYSSEGFTEKLISGNKSS